MAGVPTLQEKHPELFSTSSDVDIRTRKRIVPMEVLSLGMPRTGTACNQPSSNASSPRYR